MDYHFKFNSDTLIRRADHTGIFITEDMIRHNRNEQKYVYYKTANSHTSETYSPIYGVKSAIFIILHYPYLYIYYNFSYISFHYTQLYMIVYTLNELTTLVKALPSLFIK